jgi:hypothetical protein
MAVDAAVMSHGTWSFESRTGGKGHEVRIKIAADGSTYLTCSCPGGRFAFATTGQNRGRGCWAMQSVRKALGEPAIGRSTI